MDQLTEPRPEYTILEDRDEHVRLIMELMDVSEEEASFIAAIERGESAGDTYIAGYSQPPPREHTPVRR